MTVAAFDKLKLPLLKQPGAIDLKAGAIPGIDGMRAISVLLVVVSHYGFAAFVPGALGVTTFFFISGFLITILMLREASASGSITIGHFYIRRFLRLEPELLAYLGASSVFGILYGGFPRIGDFTYALFHVTNYWYVASTVGIANVDMRWPQLWSLAVEEHYYLTYPFLFVAFYKRPGRLLAILLGICVGALAWRAVLTGFGAPESYTYTATDARLDSIAYGCLTALALWPSDTRSASISTAVRFALPAGGALLLATLMLRSPVFRETLRYSVQGVALSLIFIGLMSADGAWLRKYLEYPALRHIGRLSYAAYLWHLEPLHVAEYLLGPDLFATSPYARPALIVVGGGATFAIAEMSHRWVYKLALDLRKRFGSHAAG